MPRVLYNVAMSCDIKHDKLPELIDKILMAPFWPPSLSTEKTYFRTQDDNDGDIKEGIAVAIGKDGDVWVQTTTSAMKTCRYRMPLIGGGRSPRVRNALLILAMAIQQDNDDDPITKKE